VEAITDHTDHFIEGQLIQQLFPLGIVISKTHHIIQLKTVLCLQHRHIHCGVVGRVVKNILEVVDQLFRQLQLQEERRQAKTKLPKARIQKIEKVYVDPVALAGIVVAVVMLVTMVLGAVQIKRDWDQYEQVSAYVSQLKKENARKNHAYRLSYDLEDIKTKATAMGLVPRSELQTMTVNVTVPEKEPELTRMEEIRFFLEGLFA
jgi:hypothetical protein